MNVRKNALEWTVFAASLLLVGGSIVVLGMMMIRAGDQPPDLIVTAGAPQQSSGGFRVPIRVRNEGDRTAGGVRVEVSLEEKGEPVERGEITFAFVPHGSERDGFVTFRRDPRCCELSARAVGFENP